MQAGSSFTSATNPLESSQTQTLVSSAGSAVKLQPVSSFKEKRQVNNRKGGPIPELNLKYTVVHILEASTVFTLLCITVCFVLY